MTRAVYFADNDSAQTFRQFTLEMELHSTYRSPFILFVPIAYFLYFQNKNKQTFDFTMTCLNN